MMNIMAVPFCLDKLMSDAKAKNTDVVSFVTPFTLDECLLYLQNAGNLRWSPLYGMTIELEQDEDELWHFRVIRPPTVRHREFRDDISHYVQSVVEGTLFYQADS